MYHFLEAISLYFIESDLQKTVDLGTSTILPLIIFMIKLEKLAELAIFFGPSMKKTNQ